MSNPKVAVSAMTACGERVGGIVLDELTLGRVAVLERIGSPFTRGNASGGRLGEPSLPDGADGADGAADAAPMGTEDILPVLFVLATPAAEAMRQVRDGTFEDAVMAWADTVPMRDIPKLTEAMTRIFKRVEALAPSGADGEGGGGKK